MLSALAGTRRQEEENRKRRNKTIRIRDDMILCVKDSRKYIQFQQHGMINNQHAQINSLYIHQQ